MVIFDILGSVEPETKEAVLRKVENCPVKRTLSKQLEFVPSSDLG